MPEFFPPTVPDTPRGDPFSDNPADRLMRYYAPQEAGETVWKDPTGAWHRNVYPYKGGNSYRTFNNGILISETFDDPNESIATAQEVYLGGHNYTITDAKATELRAAGFFVGGHWESEQNKWTNLAISNPEPNRSFIGGDATSSVLAGGNSFWTHADTSIGTVDANGYVHSMGLVKNSFVTRFNDGSLLQQVYAAAGPGAAAAWNHPNHPTRGFTPMDMVLNGSGSALSDVIVIGWTEPQVLDGSINDGIILTLNAFGGASTFTALDTGGGLFLPTAVHNSSTHHYIIGREANLQAMFPNGVVNGQPWAQDRQTNYIHLARAPLGSLTTTASWQWWDGDSWETGVANGITPQSRLVDTKGQVISGTADITLLNNKYILAAIPSTVDNTIYLYRSDNPEGPYKLYMIYDHTRRSLDKEGVPPGDPPLGFGYWYAFPKFHEYLDPDTRTFVMSYSQGLYPIIIGNSYSLLHASLATPSIVFAPKPEV